jgi:hypothetical protein
MARLAFPFFELDGTAGDYVIFAAAGRLKGSKVEEV